MNKKEAYEIVFDDLMNCGCNLFRGIYDAKHGDEKFMHGIATVMEFIANTVDFDTASEFEDLFLENMIKSQIKAGIREEVYD